MRIFTLNTQKAYQSGFNEFLIKILKEGKYDFILFQEVTVPIISLIKITNSEYEILNPLDPEFGENTHECILYKNKFVLQKQLFLSFSTLKANFPRHGWGFLGGVFTENGKAVFVASVHLHPGLRKKQRMEQIAHIKEKTLEEIGAIPIIFGGDFNFGLPGEISCSEKILFPEFRRVTKGLGPTLDSMYTEKASWGVARIANILAGFGISIKFKTDQVFVDEVTTREKDIRCHLLSERVSDHLGIEIDVE